MRFGILGPLEVDVSGQRIELRGRRRRALLIRLLVSANEVIPSRRLLADVWDDSDDARAMSTLTSHVHALREVVGRERVRWRDDGYVLRAETGEVDVCEFEAYIAAGRRAIDRGDTSSGVVSLDRALASWRGPALCDVTGLGWADQEAARLEEMRRTTHESLLAARVDLGQHHVVVASAEAAVHDEPLRELRWAVLMIALYRCGRQADALRAYRRLRAVLGADLGIDPSPPLTALEAAVLQHDPMLERAPVDQILTRARPSATMTSRRTRAWTATPLPTSRDRLIGRERDLAELRTLSNTARLVTLVGVGGVGKTRVAVETARLIAERFEKTVFVDLSAITDTAQVATATAQALQVPVPPGVSPTEALIASAGNATVLLVIDNAEHLVDAVARLVELILDHCPGCRVLVTSRQTLRVRGERVWSVEPLDATTTAVELFHDRVGRSTDHAETVELCRRLDGLPLAIELAAATCRTIAVDDVVQQLDARLDVLLDRRPAGRRHASLRATIEWSHDLLTAAERQLLRRLTVFAGGFGVRAAEAICGPLETTAPIAVILASLVDKSLVVFDRDHGRHRLLETVGRFASERLDAGEHAVYREAHARWYLDELCAQPWVDVTTLDAFTPEAPNLRRAAEWWTQQGRHRDVVVLLSRSAGVWVGLMQEHDIATRALAAYEQCRDQLAPCEEAIACALFGVALHPSRIWRQRGVDIDPQLTCRPARSNAVALALADASRHPTETIAALDALRALPGGLDPDMRAMSFVIEAQARCQLDDLDGVEALYTTLIDDHSSMFWGGPMLALAALRAVRSDVAGAEQLLALVDRHQRLDLRLAALTRQAVGTQLDIARGDLAAATTGLRELETLRDQYTTAHKSIDHLWFETAAYLAAARGDIGDAAHLADGAERTLGDGESSPFITWALRRAHDHEPAWRTALQHPLTLDQARQLARAMSITSERDHGTRDARRKHP